METSHSFPNLDTCISFIYEYIYEYIFRKRYEDMKKKVKKKGLLYTYVLVKLTGRQKLGQAQSQET